MKGCNFNEERASITMLEFALLMSMFVILFGPVLLGLTIGPVHRIFPALNEIGRAGFDSSKSYQLLDLPTR